MGKLQQRRQLQRLALRRPPPFHPQPPPSPRPSMCCTATRLTTCSSGCTSTCTTGGHPAAFTLLHATFMVDGNSRCVAICTVAFAFVYVSHQVPRSICAESAPLAELALPIFQFAKGFSGSTGCELRTYAATKSRGTWLKTAMVRRTRSRQRSTKPPTTGAFSRYVSTAWFLHPSLHAHHVGMGAFEQARGWGYRFMALVKDLITGNTDASTYEDNCRTLLGAMLSLPAREPETHVLALCRLSPTLSNLHVTSLTIPTDT